MNSTEKITHWQIVILFLSIYVLAALFIETTINLPIDTSALLLQVDNIICFVFIIDFFIQAGKRKIECLKWGWIDIISSIPSLQTLRWERFVRIIRIVRILRGFRSTKKIVYFLFKNRAKGALLSVSIISFVLVVFSSIAILNVETAVNSNIKTAGDALWWSFVTISTVGYGDFYPVTPFGRIIAVILMVAGVGLFSTITAFFSLLFVQSKDKETVKEIKKLKEELKKLKLQ